MKNKKPALLFTVLIILFVLPSVLAWVVYKEHGGVFHTASNYGELIVPPRDLSALSLSTPDGKAFSQEALRGKWLILYVSPGQCTDKCQTELYNMRQIRLATGKEMERVQRVIVTLKEGKAADPHLSQLLQNEYAGTIQLETKPKELEKWSTGMTSAPLAITQGYLYLVDPLGNVMMEYPISADPSGIFKDLKKLLKISQIG